MTERTTKLQLIDAYDMLSDIEYLNEAVFMAKADIGDNRQRNALGTLSIIIGDKIELLKEHLEKVREELA